jgi:hypothetical protein
MFRLERPSMAVNDPRVQMRRFHLGITWNIDERTTCGDIVRGVAGAARTAAGGKLKHLVVSCHGSPGHLQIAEGIGAQDVPMFSAWRGLVEKIWFPNCRVARRGSGVLDGHAFCSRLASYVQCYVVASTETQVDPNDDVPQDMMTSFEGLVLSYGPRGEVTWQDRYPSTFLKADGLRNFNP